MQFPFGGFLSFMSLFLALSLPSQSLAGPVQSQTRTGSDGLLRKLSIRRTVPVRDPNSVHPHIVHQQHVNRAHQRLARITGHPMPSDASLAANINRRIAMLPEDLQKRYNHAGISAARHATTSDAGYSQAELNAANDNTVTNAIEPDYEGSLGLDIVANDVAYVATLQLGTPPRDYLLLVDSGSADFWVGAGNCVSDSGGSCGHHTFLGPKTSSSFQETGTVFAISYGSGLISGDIVTDDVVVAGMKLPGHKFGVAKNESAQVISEEVRFDGIMGLANSSLSQENVPTIPQALAQHGLIHSVITSFYLGRSSAQTNDGEITFGGLDHAKYEPNPLVTIQNVNSGGYWAISVSTVKAGGKAVKGLGERTAILDTGTTLIVIPLEDAASLHASIPGSKFDKPTSSWTIPCTTSTILSFTIGGQDFPIDPRDLAFLPVNNKDLTGACTSGIVVGSSGVGGPSEWLVGDVFLKNVYFSTNLDANTISLAQSN